MSLPEPADVPAAMSRVEREGLSKVARLRARVARSHIGVREAELLADVEAQLAAKYSASDEAWREVTEAAQAAVKAADEQIAEACRQRGIPPEFRPGLHIGWYSRGQNMEAERRTELRRVAQTRIAALGKAAKLAIETKEAEVLTQLIAGGLASAEARAFLESIPEPEHLMPPQTLAALEAEATRRLR